MSADIAHVDASPIWWGSPGAATPLAWAAIISLILAVYLIVYLYAKFDRWAEHEAKKTPLAATIPTLLLIALLYEVFPLDHFNPLLPFSALLIALARDWSHMQGRRGSLAGIPPKEVTTELNERAGDV